MVKSTIPLISLLDSTQLQLLADRFATEIENKLKKKTSSLPCIVHAIAKPSIHSGFGYSVVIGGSNGVSAKWVVEKNKIVLHNKQSFRVPRYISDKFLYSTITKCVDTKSGVIGLNFAYGLEPVWRNGILDGVLSGNSKEARFNKQFIGKMVGKTLEEQINEKEKSVYTITVANDTICLLIATYVSQKKHPNRPIIVGIVGTGLNFAFIALKKQLVALHGKTVVQDLNNEYIAVNTESGHFASVPQTPWDQKIDRGSSKPGGFLVEKQLSGAYLYHLYNAIAKEYGLATINETADLDWIVQDTTHEGSLLANSILERSAQLTAMQILGLLHFFDIKSGTISILIEGSLFWKGYKYKDRVTSWLLKLTNVSVDFFHIQDSSLMGGAMLALTVPNLKNKSNV